MNNFYNTENIANKGRFEDTTIRTVNGEDSHVNDFEALLIDTYGKAGEKVVSEIGSGTINPNTGMKEYSWLSALFKTGRHDKRVRKAKQGLSSALGELSGKIKGMLKPGGDLYKQFKSQFEGVRMGAQSEVDELTGNLMNVEAASGLEGGSTMTDELLGNILKRYQTDFQGTIAARDTRKQQIVDQFEAQKREMIRDFASSTGYTYGGGGGATAFNQAINQYG